MNSLTKPRIESIDLLKGLVMVIMALDHTREYFHAAARVFGPLDPLHTSWAIYITRWITHFCAPTFSFLAGLSACLVGRRKTIAQLSGFLWRRGLWLVFMELTIVNFAWYFDVHFHSPSLLVIWALGISMLVLAGLVYLPKWAILVFSCTLIFGHNLLDPIHVDGSVLWAILHDGGSFDFPANYHLWVGYPLIPWIAVMSLGYCFGSLYDPAFDSVKRKRILNAIGISAVLLFLILNWTQVYGDHLRWKHYPTFSQTLMSFFNRSKYPPSLMYLLMTLGPALIFLANVEGLKGRIIDFFCTFGRVPFFFYILHLYLVHLIAMIFAQFSGFGWEKMILPFWVNFVPALNGYGFHLWVVYAVWIGIIALAYPLCKRFDGYKKSHREKWWLSYL
jgi:uncharacterized membrane protein